MGEQPQTCVDIDHPIFISSIVHDGILDTSARCSNIFYARLCKTMNIIWERKEGVRADCDIVELFKELRSFMRSQRFRDSFKSCFVLFPLAFVSGMLPLT